MRTRPWQRNGWTAGHLVGALALVLLGMLATGDAWQDIWLIAHRDEEASHAFLVPLVVAWLIWVRRRRLRHCRPAGQWIGPLLVLLGWLLYSWGDLHLVQVLWHGGALLLVVGCLLSIAGKEVLLQLAPAFVALLFIIPVPGRVRQSVAIPMEKLTAQVTQRAFEVVGTPVERSGNLLTINGVDVEIAEACNGLRMVFALVLVSYAFAFGAPLRWFVRGLVLLVSPISAIVCNVMRLVPTVWLYGRYPKGTGETFHDFSGWIMLVVSFLLLMGILRVLRWAMVPVTQYTLAYD